MTRKSAAIVAALALLTLALVPTAFAGKPGGGGSSSVSLALLNGDTQPHFGRDVTFNVSTTATSEPWVNLSCYQNGTWVSGQWQGFFPGYPWGQTFTLGPTPSWQGGAADCTARLVKFGRNGRETTLATANFHVYA